VVFTEQMVTSWVRLDPNGEFKEYPLARDKNFLSRHGTGGDKRATSGSPRILAVYRESVSATGQSDGITEMPVEKADDAHGGVRRARHFVVYRAAGNMVGRLDPKTGNIELKEVPTEPRSDMEFKSTARACRFSAELAQTRWPIIAPQDFDDARYPLPEACVRADLAIAAMTLFIFWTQ